MSLQQMLYISRIYEKEKLSLLTMHDHRLKVLLECYILKVSQVTKTWKQKSFIHKDSKDIAFDRKHFHRKSEEKSACVNGWE